MSKLIFQSFSRHLSKHPWQLGLAVLGIIVGVAVIVAIRLTQNSAFDAFDTATRTTIGSASHRIVGTDGWVSHATLESLMHAFPETALTPVLTRSLMLPDFPNRSVQLLGIEPISRAQANAGERHEIVLFDPRELMVSPLAIVMNKHTADALGVQKESVVKVRIGARTSEVKVVDVLPGAESPGGIINDLFLADIASAQEILSFFDGVDHVNLQSRDQTRIEEIGAEVDQRFAGELELIDLAAESANIKRMTAAFYSNLTALSLMALLVGMFLIYNTETFLVIQRREIIVRLRALGVSRRQILCAVLFEAGLIGISGSIIGIAGGVLLANGLLGVVSTTINDLYFEAAITSISIDRATVSISLCIGVAATLIAALIPALNATRNEPNLVLNRITIRVPEARQIVVAAAIVFVLCNTLAWIVLDNSTSPNGGFASISLIVIGFAALCPVAIIVLSRLGTLLIGPHRLLPERLGLRTVSATLNRTGTATAALMIATAASIGIGIMVTSFRTSVSEWLDSSLRADLYVADGQFDNHLKDRKIPPSIVQRIEQLQEVQSTSNVVRREVSSGAKRIFLSAFTLNSIAEQSFRFTSGEPSKLWAQWEADDVVLVTEPFAYHHGISVGDKIPLKTDFGEHFFDVVGVYRDYASERGSISLNRKTYDQHWRSSGYDGLGIYARAGTTVDELSTAVNHLLGEETSLIVKSTATLKQTSLEIFDRTFLITELLRAIAVTVSFIGVLGALLAQQLERSREYGTLRAIGLGHGEINRTVLSQTVLLGITAAIVAVPVGVLIGIVLIEVVNPRSFGWTMNLQIPLSLIMKSCGVAIVAAILAAVYPSYRASKIEPAVAIRYE
jgi:putative ABC transport system permease protein